MLLLSILFFILAIITMSYKQKRSLRAFFDTSLMVLYGLLFIIYYSANYFTGNGINETILATINLGMQDAGFREYLDLISIVFISSILLFILAFFYNRKLKRVDIAKPNRIKAFLHNAFLLVAFLTHPTMKDLFNLYKNLTLEQNNDFYNYYIEPNESNITTNKKNIVIIYAESLERTYLDEDLFRELTPNLHRLIKEYNAIDFSNINQVDGSTFTIAGMTSTQCALPLFTLSDGNSMSGIDKFYPKATCLGDILKKDDYYLSFIQGSSTTFSGIKKLYGTHGFDKIEGKDELKKRLKNKTYLNGWGLYDDSLLEFAWSEFMALERSNKHFGLVLHTMDTHHPKGQLSSSCKNDLFEDGDNEILNCVKCSDRLISSFIEKILKSKIANNTIIVITSDHLAMRNSANDILKKSKSRRDLFLVFDPTNDSYINIAKAGTPFDFTPTVLNFLGLDLDVALGRNLFTKESLFSSFENFNLKLKSWRDDILSFWSFPKISNEISIDFKKMRISFEDNEYKFPILIKIKDDSIEPYFEYEYGLRHFEQLAQFDDNEEFLWVDKCDIINTLFGEQIGGGWCIAKGKNMMYYEIIKAKNRFNLLEFSNPTPINTQNFKYQSDKLSRNGVAYSSKPYDIVEFAKSGYSDIFKDIVGLSYHQKEGRWNNEDISKDVTFILNKELPKKFKLELTLEPMDNIEDNIVLVHIGSITKELLLDSKKAKKYTLIFELDQKQDSIIISTPKAPKPSEFFEGSDVRAKSILFIDFKITPLI